MRKEKKGLSPVSREFRGTLSAFSVAYLRVMREFPSVKWHIEVYSRGDFEIFAFFSPSAEGSELRNMAAQVLGSVLPSADISARAYDNCKGGVDFVELKARYTV